MLTLGVTWMWMSSVLAAPAADLVGHTSTSLAVLAPSVPYSSLHLPYHAVLRDIAGPNTTLVSTIPVSSSTAVPSNETAAGNTSVPGAGATDTKGGM